MKQMRDEKSFENNIFFVLSHFLYIWHNIKYIISMVTNNDKPRTITFRHRKYFSLKFRFDISMPFDNNNSIVVIHFGNNFPIEKLWQLK